MIIIIILAYAIYCMVYGIQFSFSFIMSRRRRKKIGWKSVGATIHTLHLHCRTLRFLRNGRFLCNLVTQSDDDLTMLKRWWNRDIADRHHRIIVSVSSVHEASNVIFGMSKNVWLLVWVNKKPTEKSETRKGFFFFLVWSVSRSSMKDNGALQMTAFICQKSAAQVHIYLLQLIRFFTICIIVNCSNWS